MPGEIDIPAALRATTPAEDAIAETASSAGSAFPQTLADRMRARYERLLAANVEDFDVPGWEGELVARVRVIEDRDDYLATSRAADTDAAFIARAVEQLALRDVDGKLEWLEDDLGPVAFDSRFAGLLGVEAESASDMVMLALGRNPAAVTTWAQKLVGWMARTEQTAQGGLGPS